MRIYAGNRPQAIAEIRGGDKFPMIHGFVYFYEAPYGGSMLEAEVFGLPDMGGRNTPAFYAFHIHENGDCTENFSKTGNHYNPNHVEHPHHAGDMPSLLSNNGYAWLAFYNQGLKLYDIIGKSVIIHQGVDDFTTQPSGNAGEKIACGVIRFVEM